MITDPQDSANLSPPTRSPRSTKSGKSSRRRKAKPMTQARLLSAIDYREQRASGGDLFEEEQRKALKYYFGEALGDERAGESKIVMREVYSVIEWIKPMLMKVFFGSEEVLKFTPKGPDDVAAAEQETAYVSHIITDRNAGFLLFMTWFNDALLLKNGYVLSYWDERVDVAESVYNDVDIDTLTLVQGEKDIEILEAEEDGMDEETGESTYKIRIRTKETVGQVRLKAIPPERVRIDGGHGSVSLKDARYVRYSENDTISSLREQGFDVDDDINSDGGEDGHSQLAILRSQNTNMYGPDDRDEDDPDPSSREVEVHTLWIRIDYDGDGVAELRRVIKVGKEILYNEVDDSIDLASLTPTVISHRHQGMSIADAVLDIQEVKTMLARGYINNIYLANNGRYFVDDDRVNMEDFLVSRPGGVVRVRGGVTNAVQPFQHPVLGSTIIQAIEYMDNVLENRTGASPRVLQGQSFDGNAINKTATGINQIMSSVLSRIELIARIFAETGVQDLYRSVHGLSLKHARKADVFELLGSYVNVDPQQWEKRTQMAANVGVGMGDKTERVQALQMLISAQMNSLPMGLTTPEAIRSSFIKLTRLAGFKDVESFWPSPPVDPQTGQPGQLQAPQQPPDPAAQAEADKSAAEQAKLQVDQERMRNDAEAAKRKIDIDGWRAEQDVSHAQEKMFIDHVTKLAIETMKADQTAEQVQAGRDDKQADRQAGERQAERASAEKVATAAPQPQAEPSKRPVRVIHHRDEQGNLTHSEPVYDDAN